VRPSQSSKRDILRDVTPMSAFYSFNYLTDTEGDGRGEPLSGILAQHGVDDSLRGGSDASKHTKKGAKEEVV